MRKEAQTKASPVIYKANPNFVEMRKKVTEDCTHICSKHYHRPVRIEMMDGQVYEGHMVHVDNRHVYLDQTPMMAHSRGFYGYSPYGYGGYHNPYSAVLPLVLFDLLAITLL